MHGAARRGTLLAGASAATALYDVQLYSLWCGIARDCPTAALCGGRNGASCALAFACGGVDSLPCPLTARVRTCAVRCRRIRVLHVPSNKLTGTIPSTIVGMTSLMYVTGEEERRWCWLSGFCVYQYGLEADAACCCRTPLVVIFWSSDLDLSFNNFTGTIPGALGTSATTLTYVSREQQ